MTVKSSSPTQKSSPSTSHRLRIPAWRWGVAVLLTVLLIVGGSYVARGVVKRLRQPAPVAAPALPPIPVVAVTAPDTSYEHVALDSAVGHLVALTAPSQPECGPIGACPPPRPALDRFVVLDDQTAQPIATTPLTGEAAPAADAALLLVDSVAHRAYAVAPHAVVIFSTEDGRHIGGYALPGEIRWERPSGGVFWPRGNALILQGGGQLVTLDASTGRILHRQSVASLSGALDGPALGVDSDAAEKLYLLRRGAAVDPALLLTFDPDTLALTAQISLPVNGALGPVAPGAGATVFGVDGETYRVSAPPGNPVQRDVTERGALALGFDGALQRTYVVRANDVQIHAHDGTWLASLPLRIAWTPSESLLVDTQRNLVYLPTDHGAIVIARDVPVFGTLTPGSAALLARQALQTYLPDTNQDPPFLDAHTFWPGAGSDGTPVTRHVPLYIHYSDQGWTGPYDGTAQTQVISLPGQAGAYRVTFTIGWYLLYPRQHSWTLDVAPDGSVSLSGEGGDVVP